MKLEAAVIFLVLFSFISSNVKSTIPIEPLRKQLTLGIQRIGKIIHPFVGGKNLTETVYPDETCYHIVGCFSNREPWNQLLRPIPSPNSPEEVNVNVVFYNRDNPGGLLIELLPEIKIEQIPFDVNKETFTIFHGFERAGFGVTMIKMKNALLEAKDANVLISGWAEGANSNYLQAVGNARLVGALTAILLDKTGIPPKNLHLIGHSLGAHAASYCAKRLATFDKKPAQISALDPASPLFEGFSSEVRLTRTDAHYVVVYHTNAGVRGYLFPYGDLDFYINSGSNQPTCLVQAIEQQLPFYICSHEFSLDVFTSAIQHPDCFVGQKPTITNFIAATINGLSGGNFYKQAFCPLDGCVPVGLDLDKSKHYGVYVVFTHAPPYLCHPSKKPPILKL